MDLESKKRLLQSLRTEPGVFSGCYVSSPVGEGALHATSSTRSAICCSATSWRTTRRWMNCAALASRSTTPSPNCFAARGCINGHCSRWRHDRVRIRARHGLRPAGLRPPRCGRAGHPGWSMSPRSTASRVRRADDAATRMLDRQQAMDLATSFAAGPRALEELPADCRCLVVLKSAVAGLLHARSI